MSVSSNSGNAFSCCGNIFLADLKNHAHTAIFDRNMNLVQKFNFNAWFMCELSGNLFFCDRTRDNGMYAYSTSTGECSQLNTTPCSNIKTYNNDLYYVDEKSSCLIKYNILDGNSDIVLHDKIKNYCIDDNKIYYLTDDNIRVFDLKLCSSQKFAPVKARNIMEFNHMLVYADNQRDGVLSVIDVSSSGVFQIDTVKAESFATSGKYIYATNKIDNGSIIRIDIFKGEIIRVHGSASFNLHCMDEYVYFLDMQGTWNRLPIAGGVVEKIGF